MIHRRHAMMLLSAFASMPRVAFAEVTPPGTSVVPSLAQHFTDVGTEGTFAGYLVDQARILVSDDKRSGEGKLPASTFKVANSLVALDTGVVRDPDVDVFKWDGVTRPIAAWNKDHTLRSAIAASAVPVYQEIARRIGPQRMQAYLDKFGYGNRNIGGGIDQFWLTGDLRISPIGQIDFLDKLRRGVLPVSKTVQASVRDIMPVVTFGETKIRSKTGLLGAEIGKPSLGWLVGWTEKNGGQCVFALNLDVRNPSHTAARETIARKCLAEIGAI